MNSFWIAFARPLAGALLLVSAIVHAEPTTITFLHVNDVSEYSSKRGIGGVAPLMTLLRRERAQSANTITTFGGDLFSPSLMSGLTKGAHMVDLMNAIGVDIAVAGNHEYDFGPEVAARNFAASTFPWLGTNVHGPDGTPADGLGARRVVERGGFRIGFFGLVTPETDVLSSPGESIVFAPVLETARSAVAALKVDGADVIVALTHLDFPDERELAAEVEGIHLILGGHDHVPLALRERGVAILQAGYDAHYLGVVDLHLEWVERRGKRSLSVLPEWRLVTTAGVAPDPEVQALVDRYEARLDKELGVVIGTTSVELDTRRSSVRTAETNFGNLVAEAMRRGVGAEVGLTNGGGIRGDRTYAPGTGLTRKGHPDRASVRQHGGSDGAVRSRPPRRARERGLPGRGRGGTVPPDRGHDPRPRSGRSSREPGGGGRGGRRAPRPGRGSTPSPPTTTWRGAATGTRRSEMAGNSSTPPAPPSWPPWSWTTSSRWARSRRPWTAASVAPERSVQSIPAAGVRPAESGTPAEAAADLRQGSQPMPGIRLGTR